jgi:hypothetical protein
MRKGRDKIRRIFEKESGSGVVKVFERGEGVEKGDKRKE